MADRQSSSMLVGFNHDVRHLGRRFHIQTEDSGLDNPLIVTHLFDGGGRILHSCRASYSTGEGAADPAKVGAMMRAQHVAMRAALVSGQLDHLVEATGRQPAASETEDAQPRRPGREPLLCDESLRTRSLDDLILAYLASG